MASRFAQHRILTAHLLLLGALAAHPPPASAQILQYTDNEGRTHFVDSAEKIPEEYRTTDAAPKELAPISRVKPEREKLYEKERYDTKADYSGTKPEIYVAEWCPHCKHLEQFLKAEGITYTRYDVENSGKGQEMMAKLGGGVPLIKIGPTIIRGFQPEAIKAALKKK